MKGKIWLGKQWVGINQIRGWSEDALHFRNQKISAVQCRSLKKCSRVHWGGWGGWGTLSSPAGLEGT